MHESTRECQNVHLCYSNDVVVVLYTDAYLYFPKIHSFVSKNNTESYQYEVSRDTRGTSIHCTQQCIKTEG